MKPKPSQNYSNDQINITLTDDQIEHILSPVRERIVVASIGPFSFDVSEKDIIKKRVKVTVIFFGIPVGDVILDSDSFEQSLGPNIGIAKASITLIVNWGSDKVVFHAKACVRNWRMKWKCADYEGTVVTW